MVYADLFFEERNDSMIFEIELHIRYILDFSPFHLKLEWCIQSLENAFSSHVIHCFFLRYSSECDILLSELERPQYDKKHSSYPLSLHINVCEIECIALIEDFDSTSLRECIVHISIILSRCVWFWKRELGDTLAELLILSREHTEKSTLYIPNVSLYPGSTGRKHSRIFDWFMHGWLHTFFKSSIKVSENQFPIEKSNNRYHFLKERRFSIQSSGLIGILYLSLEKRSIMSQYG